MNHSPHAPTLLALLTLIAVAASGACTVTIQEPAGHLSDPSVAGEVPLQNSPQPVDDELVRKLTKVRQDHREKLAGTRRLREAAAESDDPSMLIRVEALERENEARYEERLRQLRHRYGNTEFERALDKVKRAEERARGGGDDPTPHDEPGPAPEPSPTAPAPTPEGEPESAPQQPEQNPQPTPEQPTPSPDPLPEPEEPAPPTPATDTPEQLVTICHAPPGKGAARRTIQVSRSALDAHLRHGDTLGPCESDFGEGEGSHEQAQAARERDEQLLDAQLRYDERALEARRRWEEETLEARNRKDPAMLADAQRVYEEELHAARQEHDKSVAKAELTYEEKIAEARAKGGDEDSEHGKPEHAPGKGHDKKGRGKP